MQKAKSGCGGKPFAGVKKTVIFALFERIKQKTNRAAYEKKSDAAGRLAA